MNKKLKRRLSWMSRLIILYIIVMGIILLVQIFYIVPYIRDRELESAESYQEEIATNVSFIINTKFSEVKKELSKITILPEFSNMDIEAQTDILVNHAGLSAQLLNLFVMDSEGWFVSSSLEDLSPWQKKSHTDQPPYKISFIKGETYYSNLSYFETVGEVSFHIGIPIKSETEETVGVLISAMLLNDLIEMIYKYDLKNGTHITLVDTEGTVIAISGIDLYALEDGPLSLSLSDRPGVQTLIGGSTGSFIDEHEGITYLNSTSLILSNGWGVIVETPMDVLMAETNEMTRFLWLINSMLFIVPLIVLVVFSRQIDHERLGSEKMLQEHSKDLERIVTELKKRTKELKVAHEKLITKEKLSVLGQLAGGVAHDLRNPLTSIKNASYFLNMAIEKPGPDIKKTLEVLDKATVNSEEIITNILGFANHGTPIKRKIDIGNILKDIITQTTIPDSIKVTNSLGRSLPAVTADPGQITRVFSNIIQNAIQAMPDGGKLSVKYTATGKKWLEISISDTGSGIMQENIDKVFEPLFTTKAKGIGLGMAITKTLVDAHGGSIRIKSKIGKGTTFTVVLPIKDK